AAVSCSNSGLYATSRCIFALSKEGMAPAWLGRVNARGVPYNARENLCRKCEDRAGIVRKTDTNTPPGEDERGRLRV
ncbi:MAG: hypothetical protein FJX76_06715, partial [Armatimonadetes bacterium]|nr:hypothetical protein [Armatimonadota bacterium]